MPRKPGQPKNPQPAAKSKSKVPRKRRATAEIVESPPIDAVEPAEILEHDSAPLRGGNDEAVELSDFHAVEPAADGDDSAPAVAAIDSDSEAGESDGDGDKYRALVPIDPLSRYLSEIRRFPLLTREQETEIAKRYYKEKQTTGQGDPADAYRLVTANLRLVVKIAYEFARATRNVLDLIQEGNVGLMEAVKNFDPGREIRFPSYAVWWVRAYIYRYLINNWRLVKIGTTQAQRKLFFNLRKETERLEAQGFSPQPLLLAHRMGVKESEVREMQERMGQSEVSLDQPVGSGDDSRLLDVIPDSEHNPETELADREWRDFAHDQVERFAKTLDGKELEIFNARLLAEDPETLQEIGARFGISRERVRQIETRLKSRLKEFIESDAPDVDDAGPQLADFSQPGINPSTAIGCLTDNANAGTTMPSMKWDKPLDFEYLQAADPDIPAVPIKAFPAGLHREGPTRVIHFDNSKELKTDYPATSPNCLASYLRIEAGKSLTTDIQATSHLFYVLRGRGEIKTESTSVRWAQDDIITLPACDSIEYHADVDAAVYWVNDSPLLRFLGVTPAHAIFNPVHYPAEWLRGEVRKAAAQPGAKERNRIGVLLANAACPLTRTITPTLWSLLEVVPPGLVLPPHRHNSVALDLAISGCARGYTLMGAEIDVEGKIKNPIRVDWADASAFTTPPMLWHEHHNEGDEEAWVFPVQDAGLVTYGRILEIKFAAGGPTKRGVSAF